MSLPQTSTSRTRLAAINHGSQPYLPQSTTNQSLLGNIENQNGIYDGRNNLASIPKLNGGSSRLYDNSSNLVLPPP